MTDVDRRRLTVVTVMPPASDADHESTLDRWVTSTRLLEALAATGRVDAIGLGRSTRPGEVVRQGVRHVFVASDRDLVAAVCRLRPDVVHVHGTGFVSLLGRLRFALHGTTPIVVQHHGEPVGPRRNRAAHRMLRGGMAAYLFTGADHGQAEPFRRAGVIGARTPVFDVLEAASTLPDDAGAPAIELVGSPSVLWVGRVIADKAPEVAVDALAESGVGDAHLHLLVTDPTLLPDVLARAEARGVGSRVHVHPAVDRAEIHRWYRGADVLLSTSRHEGSNYSLVEAMGHGCHPVVSDLPSHRSILGPLVDQVARPFPVDDARRAGRRLAEAARSGDRAPIRRHAETQLSWTAVACEVLAAYDAVLSSGRWS